jgi:hypothetical protein
MRHVGQLVHEEIACHERHCEGDNEYRQPTVGDRPRALAIVSMWRFAGWFGVIVWMFRQCWLSLAPSYPLIELYNNQSSMTAIAGVSRRSPDRRA